VVRVPVTAGVLVGTLNRARRLLCRCRGQARPLALPYREQDVGRPHVSRVISRRTREQIHLPTTCQLPQPEIQEIGRTGRRPGASAWRDGPVTREAGRVWRCGEPRNPLAGASDLRISWDSSRIQ
jgi:hypothetical protein